MAEIIDLSQEIFADMPIFKGMPAVKINMHASHEQWDGDETPTTQTPSALLMTMSEHTGTHVDALSHMARKHKTQSIETMPLSMFYTEGVCLDVSDIQLQELIEPHDLEMACSVAGVDIQEGDTVLIYTNHYRKTYGTDNWLKGAGLSAEATRWLGRKGIAAFGVESPCPGVSGLSNREVHRICGEMGFTHYENLMNLHLLVGRGRFRFIGLPLKIRGGTGSPVRAIAVFE